MFPPMIAWITIFVYIPIAGGLLFMRYGMGFTMGDPNTTELVASMDDQISDRIEERYNELQEETKDEPR